MRKLWLKIAFRFIGRQKLKNAIEYVYHQFREETRLLNPGQWDRSYNSQHALALFEAWTIMQRCRLDIPAEEQDLPAEK